MKRIYLALGMTISAAIFAASALTLAIFTLGCTTVIEEHNAFRPCDPTVGTSTTDASTSSSSSGSTGDDFTCPTIANGNVVFDVNGVSRSAYFVGVPAATSASTLLMYWHGTYEGNSNPITGALPYGMQTMAANAHALLVIPRADQAAIDRPDGDFPWWVVCSGINPQQCDRTDDFVFAEMIAACAVDQGLADPDRLTTGGMSAGGIMVSELVEHGIGGNELAAATSWSGGQIAAHQPAVPDSAATAVFALHGGTNDVYCGVGQPAGSCNGYTPYAFSAPSERLASDVNDVSTGRFAFACNHNSGHNAVMGEQGTEFLLVADAGGAHPWRGFPFGVDGYDAWPSMSGGTNWMLRFYGDCHPASEP